MPPPSAHPPNVLHNWHMNRARAKLSAAVLCWSVVAVGVWVWMTAYGFEADEPASNFRHTVWPIDARISPADNRPTLLFFMHPRCTCTRASLSELEKLLAGRRLKKRELPALVVVVSVPAKASAEWQETDTVRRAMQLPNSTVFWDCGGEESMRFGATTSGTVMLYRGDGSRQFAGGITAMRAHEGDNAGSERLLRALVENNRRPLESTPVFGCRLWASAAGGGSVAKVDLQDTDFGNRESR